jgi:hypothetical protein
MKDGMIDDARRSHSFWDPAELWECPHCNMLLLSRTGYSHYLSMVFKFRFTEEDGHEGWSWDTECMCETCNDVDAPWQGPFIAAFNQTCADRAMRWVLGG